MASLAALTLLECGVPPDDPAIQVAAAFVRRESVKENQTYCLALGILFLDRLGEEVDVALVEGMAARLLAGQMADGGWTYYSGMEVVADQEGRLSKMVTRRNEGGAQAERRAPRTDERRTPEDLGKESRGEIEKILKRPPVQPGGQIRPTTENFAMPPDNSNTQFAILAL